MNRIMKNSLSLLIVFMMLFTMAPLSYAHDDLSINLSIEGEQVTINGKTTPDTYVTLLITRAIDHDKMYVDQTRSDGDGNYSFQFEIEDGTYEAVVTSNGIQKEKEIIISNNDGVDIPTPDKETVTLSIDKLTINKGYVVKNAIVTLRENDTVWSVLKRELDKAGINYAYKWYQIYESVYIQSIDGDGEFDHGSGSGWMYSVNGWYPNYGASKYKLEDGDVIKWRYTTRLGRDIGANIFGGDSSGDNTTDVDNRDYKEENEIVNNPKSTESEVVKAVKDIAGKLNSEVNSIKTEEDARETVKTAKDVTSIIQKAAERIETEEAARAVAKDIINIIKDLGKSAEKLTNFEDNKEVSKLAAENIQTTIKIIDKIKVSEEINKLSEDIIKVSADLIKRLGKENSDEIQQKAVASAAIAIEKSSVVEIEKNQLKEENNKIVAQVDEGIIKVKADNKKATIKIMKNILEENGFNFTTEIQSKVTIAVPKSNKQEIETKLPSGMIKALKENGVEKASLKTEIATINITPKTFGEKAEGKEISLSAKKVDRNQLTDAQRRQIPDLSPMLDLNVKVGEEKVSEFEEAIEVSIPYEGEVEEGQTVEVFFLADDGSIESKGGTYDHERKIVTFTTYHFSKYFAKKVKTTVTFNDLQGFDWANEAIETMASNKIINGRGEGIFDPSANITRAEFATLVTKMMGYSNNNTEVTFTDVPKDAWYYRFVGAAYKNGLINGRSADIFDPDGNITREEMAVIIGKVLEKKGYKKSSLKELNIFNDKENIATWAKDYVSLCVKESIITGMADGTFAPRQNANRAQAAVMLYRVYKLIK